MRAGSGFASAQVLHGQTSRPFRPAVRLATVSILIESAHLETSPRCPFIAARRDGLAEDRILTTATHLMTIPFVSRLPIQAANLDKCKRLLDDLRSFPSPRRYHQQQAQGRSPHEATREAVHARAREERQVGCRRRLGSGSCQQGEPPAAACRDSWARVERSWEQGDCEQPAGGCERGPSQGTSTLFNAMLMF